MSLRLENTFQDLLAKELSNFGWFVKKEVVDQTGKHRIDFLAYHTLIDCWIGIELKTPRENSDYTKCLAQLIEYRKSKLLPSPRLLCLVSSSDVEWYHYRYFWRFGFGVGDYSLLDDDLLIGFPPNGDNKTSLNLKDLGWKRYYSHVQDLGYCPPSYAGLDPKKQVEDILSVCIPRWRIFGYEHKH